MKVTATTVDFCIASIGEIVDENDAFVADKIHKNFRNIRRSRRTNVVSITEF
jgi:hypothetical protein